MKSKIHPRLLFTTGFISLNLFQVSTNAAQVGFVGVINDNTGSEITDWKTAATNKTLDGDGDNVYGTLAHLFYGVEFKGQNTLYQYDSGDSQYGPDPGYAVVDDPTGDGTTPGDIQVRTTTNGGLNDANHVMFTFTALAGSPANVRIGIATDGLNNGNFASASIGIRQVGGMSAEHTMTSTNATPDMVFFNVTGVAAGDQFQIFGDSGVNGYATHQFVTWDALPTYVWDGTANSWNSAHWDAGAGLVTFPVGDSNANSATINSGTVTFAGNDTFGGNLTPTSPIITINNGGTLASGGFFNTMWNLTLNGGTLLANGGVNDPFGAFKLSGTVTVGGSIASNISSDAGSFSTVALGLPFTTFDIADVTTSTMTDLTISAVLSNLDGCGLIKVGAGTLKLTASNTYAGNTIVNMGILSLGNGTTNTSLADTAGVVIGSDPSAILNLNYSGSDTIASLTINGVVKAPGVYGSSDPSGRITGSGTLTVGTVSPYTTWANSFLPGNNVSNPAGDNDNDGLTNQQEFAFGLSPISGSSVNPILVQVNKTTGQFSYQRRASSGLTYKVLTSTTLAVGSWTQDVTASQVAGATDGNGNQTVVVTLTGAPLAASKLFVRVAAE